MTVSVELRRSDLYKGDGSVKEFSFPFKVFSADQLLVYRSVSETVDEVVSSEEYSVELNADQETTAGGKVIFTTAPANGVALRIVSNVDYLQESEIRNQAAFYPKTLNDVHDKLTMMCQQLLEQVERCVIVPVTSSTTREELLQQLMNVAASANEYARLAEKTYQEVLAARIEIEELEPKIVASVEATRDEVVSAVTAEGEAQYERLQAIGDWAASQLNASCQEATLTVSQAVEAGATVTLPSGLRYLPSRKHLRVSWNGIVLSRGKHWKDVGTEDDYSESFVILIPLAVGDEVNAFIAPLGSEDFATEIARITALEEAFADLSQRVVYKDEGSSE